MNERDIARAAQMKEDVEKAKRSSRRRSKVKKKAPTKKKQTPKKKRGKR